jgi:hypothetical protein
MINVSLTTHGFEVQDKSGGFLAWCEHVEVALRRMHEIDAGESVRRVRDDALIATKLRLRGESFWSELWAA